MTLPRMLDRYRQPEYTGADRCLPCTVLNVLVGILAGMTTWPLVRSLGGSPSLALLVAATVLVIALVRVWLRGYLVPETPTLARRYLPARVHRLFGKKSAPGIATHGDADDDE